MAALDLEAGSEKASIIDGREGFQPVPLQTSTAEANAKKLAFTRTLTQSLTFSPAPAVSQPEHRVPAEFTILSIHVTLTRDGDTDGHTAPQGRKSVKELAQLDWQAITADEAATRLGVNPSRGLDKEVAERRLASDGPNVIKATPVNWPKV